ncbi:MAG: hypothetical protein AAGH40_02415 [Verrucomicrobiota bacterium]
MNQIPKEILAYGNCVIVRFRGKAAYGKDMSPRTGTWYKADGTGELAQHSEARGSLPEVNHGVVYQNSVLLPWEASLPSPVWFKSTGKDKVASAAMPWLSNEESAEGIVVVSEPVSSRRVLRVGEGYGQHLRSKARTEEGEATGGEL